MSLLAANFSDLAVRFCTRLTLVFASWFLYSIELGHCRTKVFVRVIQSISTFFDDSRDCNCKLHVKHVGYGLVQIFRVNSFIIYKCIKGLEVLPSITERLKKRPIKANILILAWYLPLDQPALLMFPFFPFLTLDNCPSSFVDVRLHSCFLLHNQNDMNSATF